MPWLDSTAAVTTRVDDVLIAQQPVDLLDRMLRHQTARLRQRLPDHRDRQRCAGHYAQRRPGQAVDPLGMSFMPANAADKCTDVFQTPAKPPLQLFHVTLEFATTQYAVGNRVVFTLDLG
jgi:hypothetical protein